MAVNIGAIQATLAINTAAFAAGMDKASSKISQFGKKTSAVGKKLTKSVTLPIVGVGILAVKAAKDFESSFAGVRKTVDATEKEFKSFEKQLRKTALELPINVNELNRIAEAAGQLGIKKKNIVSFTKTMAKLGVTTNLTSEEAATGMARFANILQLPQKEVSNLGSVLVDLGNNLATTEKEILDMGLRLAGTGKVIGLTETDILGFAGALSSVGIRAEAGGTAFSRVMSDIALAAASGGEDIQKFAEVAGQSAEDFSKSFEETPAQAMQAFIEGLARVKLEGGNTFGVLEELDLSNVRVRTALLNTAGAGDLVGESLSRASTAFEENTALTKEAEQRFKTFDSQLILLKNEANDAAITFGNLLLPSLLDIIRGVKPLIRQFKDLSPATQKIIIKGALLAAALGPIVFVIGGVIQAVGALGVALSFLAANPVFLVIAAFVALAELTSRVTTGKGLLENATSALSNETDAEAQAHGRAERALRSYQDAAAASKNADLGLKQAKTNLDISIRGQERAQEALTSAQKNGETSAGDLKDAELRLEQSSNSVESAQLRLKDAQFEVVGASSKAAGAGHELKVSNDQLEVATLKANSAHGEASSSLAILRADLGDTEDAAASGGRAIGQTWGQSLVDSIIGQQGALTGALNFIKGLLGSSLPTAGPLTNPGAGGASIGDAWTEGMINAMKDNLPALEAQLTAIESKMQAFQGRTQNIGSDIQRMLGTLFGKQKTRTELKIEREDVKRQNEAFRERVTKALVVIEDPEASAGDKARAEKEIKAVQFEKNRIADQAKASIEREKLQERQRVAMERFQKVVGQIEAGEIKRSTGERIINSILSDVGLTFKQVRNLTQEVDSQFNRKLRTSITEIGKTATKIRELIVKQLASEQQLLIARRVLNTAKAGERLANSAKQAAIAARKAADAARVAANKAAANTTNPPKFGRGGLFTKPTLGIVGDVPELVVPLSKLGNLPGKGGGGDTFNVTINASGDVDGARLAGDFTTEMERQLSNANIRRGI